MEKDLLDSSRTTASAHADLILPLTRGVAYLIIPFLVAAFIILYVDGTRTALWFAWEIPSRVTTALMGSGYLGGAYFFLRVGTGWQWHRVQAGFLPVAVFTATMLLGTLLHFDAFLSDRWPFWVWLVLYVVTPVLVPAVWWINRRADPHLIEPGERIVPGWLRILMAIAGAVLLLLCLATFLMPGWAISFWPWTLSPLTARVMAAFHALLATGAVTLAADRRWSAWAIPMQTIALWQLLFLLALFWHRTELGEAGLLSWYTPFILGGLAGLLIVTVFMRRQPKADGR